MHMATVSIIRYPYIFMVFFSSIDEPNIFPWPLIVLDTFTVRTVFSIQMPMGAFDDAVRRPNFNLVSAFKKYRML